MQTTIDKGRKYNGTGKRERERADKRLKARAGTEAAEPE
jgi:hypothetical protein